MNDADLYVHTIYTYVYIYTYIYAVYMNGMNTLFQRINSTTNKQPFVLLLCNKK